MNDPRTPGAESAARSIGAPVSLSLQHVLIGERLRNAVPEHVTALAESIAEIGLQTPITVVESAEFSGGRKLKRWQLVAGLHRLEACRKLGHAEIAAFVVEMKGADRGLWECDENLCRAELTPAQRAKFTAQRKMWYEIKHPETRHPGNGGTFKGNQHVVADNLSATTFSKDTATKTGSTERDIRRDARRGEKIAPDVIDAITGTEHDKGTTLDAFVRMRTAKEQRSAVQALKAGKPLPAPKQKPRSAAHTLCALKQLSALTDEELIQATAEHLRILDQGTALTEDERLRAANLILTWLTAPGRVRVLFAANYLREDIEAVAKLMTSAAA